MLNLSWAPTIISSVSVTFATANYAQLLMVEFKSCSVLVFIEKNSDVIETTKVQLNQYFSGARTSFDLPLITAGTPFQKSVWDALQTIRYGETLSYQGLATTINKEGAVRAVGTANGANALAIIIPCHRVIASDGSSGGYAGGLPLKKRLLALEEKVLAYKTIEQR